MKRILSTYQFISRKLTPELLGQISAAGFHGVEIFASRGHFDYTSRTEAQAMAAALAANHLFLSSLHAPTSRDLSATREGGTPVSICEVERVRRIEAMDELKRAIDISEDLPYPRMVLHMGGPRETADPRKRDAAFSSLEHLILHAHHAGVVLSLENTNTEMGDPKSFAPLRELVAGVHLHDNHGDKDEHLPPYDGTIDWPAAIALLHDAPAENLPLTLELKEKTAPDAPNAVEQLDAARQALDKFEEAW
jgi:sugar phosphate isomerase/epimerase